MAKKPLPPKRTPVAKKAAQSGKPSRTPKSEAAGRFDKFAAFALAIPSTILAVIALVMAVGYTLENFDVGFMGFPAKTITSYNQGSEAVQKIGGSPQITGFEQTNYIGRVAEGEMDVVVLNVGRENNVKLGDVFLLGAGTPENVRLEFVVFDLQDNVSRAYILLGQDVSNEQEREYSLKMSDLERLCGGTSDIDVSRTWEQQIIRRYAESRSSAG